MKKKKTKEPEKRGRGRPSTKGEGRRYSVRFGKEATDLMEYMEGKFNLNSSQLIEKCIIKVGRNLQKKDQEPMENRV